MKSKTVSAKQQLAALEKRWAAGLLAPHEALQVCIESGMPRHQWPRWIESGIEILQDGLQQKTETPAAPKAEPVPMSGPEQTRFLASLALWAQRKHGCDAKAAAGAAIVAYNKLPNVRPRFPEGAAVVDRVVREMTKQRNDPKRSIHIQYEQVSRLIPHLPTSSRKKRI